MAIKFGTDKDIPSYDAMIYQTSTHTIAIDKAGRRISSSLISNQTDDVVFKAALVYLNGLGSYDYDGFTLYIGSGTYIISAELPITKPHTILGAGGSKTILKARTAYLTDKMININNAQAGWYPTSLVLRDFQLHGNLTCKYGVTFGDAWATVNNAVIGAHIENITFTRFLRYGVIDNSYYGTTYRSCTFYANGVSESSNTDGTISPTALTAYTAGAGTTDTLAIITNAAANSLSTDTYHYDWWYLYNITRGAGSLITDYRVVAGANRFTVKAATAIAGQVAGDTFNISPPYGGIWFVYSNDVVVDTCSFRENCIGIFLIDTTSSKITNCTFFGNRYFGILSYDLVGLTFHTTKNHISGCYFSWNGTYKGAVAPRTLYDIYIPDAVSTYNTITDVYSQGTYVASSLYTLGNNTTILNYTTSSGVIGTLGGVGSLNLNLSVAGVSALVYKGAIDCSGNPDYPAASIGDKYSITVPGKVGGVAGHAVAAGDFIICHTAGIAGDEAAVGANWDVIHESIGRGSATVLAGNTSVVVAHGLGGAPTNIILAPGDAISGRDYWSDTIGAVNFTLNISSADVVDHIFYWAVG